MFMCGDTQRVYVPCPIHNSTWQLPWQLVKEEFEEKGILHKSLTRGLLTFKLELNLMLLSYKWLHNWHSTGQKEPLRKIRDV